MSQGWPLVPLGEVVTYRKEFILIDDLATYKRCRVQLHAQGIVLRDLAAGAEIKTKEQQVCHTGEFLVAEIDAKIGGFGIVPDELEGAIVSSHYFLFRLNEEALDRRFLNFFIRTPVFQDQVQAQGSTNYAAIRPANVLSYTIPLPPLPEQQRIVARVEALASRIAEAQKLRQETVTEVEALWTSAASNILNSLANAPAIPIESLAEVRGGIQKSPSRTPGANPVRYLTVVHVHRNKISLSDPRFFEVSPSELERCRLLPGDVLVIEGNGSEDQIGRTALFRGEIKDCVHQNHVIRVRPNQEIIHPEFVNTYLNSPFGQAEVQARSRTSSGLRSLSTGRIKQIAIPTPPLPEQRRIVAYLDDLQARVDALKAAQAASAAELAALLPAVLDRAFAGAL
ncbi:MAG TPA: restriction endonuclease subunit S [Chloroflexia bacterium]|nr:restriction endonuclease subunit S [Chloroflexia bacterium]